MARLHLRAVALTVVLSAWTWHAAQAQQPGSYSANGAPARLPEFSRNARPMSRTSRSYGTAQPVYYAQEGSNVPGPAPVQPDVANRAVPGYPYLNAPMYSSPRQNVPYQTGGAVITNQAFSPHEMLYAHKYKAMYPPYYYQVRGHWKVTPWGVAQCEDWKLRGTVVTVKYKSHISPLAGFHPPAIH